MGKTLGLLTNVRDHSHYYHHFRQITPALYYTGPILHLTYITLALYYTGPILHRPCITPALHYTVPKLHWPYITTALYYTSPKIHRHIYYTGPIIVHITLVYRNWFWRRSLFLFLMMSRTVRCDVNWYRISSFTNYPTLVYIIPVYLLPPFNLTTNHGQNSRYFRPCY